METTFLKTILNQNAYGYAWLNQQLCVVESNRYFGDFSVHPGSPDGMPLQQLFPETIGLEAVLQEILSGSRQAFVLEKLNRETADAGNSYFTLSLYPAADSRRPLFCLIQDATAPASLLLHINQQKNSIRLLEGLLKARGAAGSQSILGDSEPIRQIRHTIGKMANIPAANILLVGESGTGKSMIARVLHHSSQGSKHPFVEINCAAIPENLLESELFGYEKGAFTNAVNSKKGLLEEAHLGTLFLDEIAELPLKLQAKLLSFLETRRFRRLGSNSEIEVQIRLITASNRDLAAMVREKTFREDLFYRLNVVKIALPNLRELGSDVLLIAGSMAQQFNRDFNKSVQGFTAGAQQKLQAYTWPGNIRELRNAVERAMIFCEGTLIRADDLQLGSLRPAGEAEDPLERFSLPPEGLAFHEIECRILSDALALGQGNQSRAAQLLHMSRDAFRYRLEKYNLIPGGDKPSDSDLT